MLKRMWLTMKVAIEDIIHCKFLEQTYIKVYNDEYLIKFINILSEMHLVYGEIHQQLMLLMSWLEPGL